MGAERGNIPGESTVVSLACHALMTASRANYHLEQHSGTLTPPLGTGMVSDERPYRARYLIRPAAPRISPLAFTA
jgi:hypothetical protein